MKLSFEQIKRITVGALRIEQETDGIHFYKYTQQLIDAWSAKNKTLGERAAGTGGVRLDFHTDSGSIKFYASRGEKFELYINGLLRCRMTAGQEYETRLADPYEDTREETRVTIYFPSHEEGGVLERLEMEDGASLHPHAFDCKILFMGDSITQGWQTEYDSLSYANRISRMLNADSVIQGVGGAFYDTDCMGHIPYDPDIVVSAYGTNDLSRCRCCDEFRMQVRGCLEFLASEYAGKRIFVISPIWREEQQGKAMTLEECRQVIVEEAARYGLAHINGRSLVPPISEFFTDGLHPNDNGFSLYAENLFPILQQAKNNL